MRKDALAALLGLAAADFEIRVENASGDCFYLCVVHSLPEQVLSVASLRDVVASGLSVEAFADLQAVCFAVPGYEWVSGKTLEEARSELRKAEKVWADECAIKTIVDSLGLCLLVVNEGGRGSGGKASLDRIGDPEGEIVVLNRTRREHYNLVVLGEGVDKVKLVGLFTKLA